MFKKILLLTNFLFLLSGCNSSNTLTCSNNQTLQNIESNITYNIDYSNNEVKKIRATYDYVLNNIDNNQDGVGTGTDGTTSDDLDNENGIIDGVIGNTFDDIISGITDVILDVSGIKNRHIEFQNYNENLNGFSYQNLTDDDKNYKVTYILDFDNLTDDEITKFNFSRNLNELKNYYINKGFTCN